MPCYIFQQYLATDDFFSSIQIMCMYLTIVNFLTTATLGPFTYYASQISALNAPMSDLLTTPPPLCQKNWYNTIKKHP